MGDMADFYNDQVEEMEFERGNFRMGLMSELEAYEKGIIDEFGYEANAWTGRTISCRCCKKKNLHWQQHNGKFRLFDGRGIHKCPKNPLKENFKPGAKK